MYCFELNVDMMQVYHVCTKEEIEMDMFSFLFLIVDGEDEDWWGSACGVRLRPNSDEDALSRDKFYRGPTSVDW